MGKFDFNQGQAYFKGQFVAFGEANVSVASASVLYGLAVYTVVPVRYDSSAKKYYIFRLKEHYQRLVNSAQIMGFKAFDGHLPLANFESIFRNLLKLNQPKTDVMIRCCYFVDENLKGAKMVGQNTGFSAFIYGASQLLPAKGANICVSSWIRTPDNAIPSRAKVNGSYANSALLKNEALLNGYDEAVATDGQGHLTEGSVMNLFLVVNGQLVTPAANNDILEGITRDSVFNLAKDQGWPVSERQVDRSELYTAEEAFFCGSTARITPILSVDKRPISQQAGPYTKRLASLYDSAQLAKLPKFKAWATTVTV